MYELIEENEFGKEVAHGEFESIEDATTHLRKEGFQDIDEDNWVDQGDDVLIQRQFTLVVI